MKLAALAVLCVACSGGHAVATDAPNAHAIDAAVDAIPADAGPAISAGFPDPSFGGSGFSTMDFGGGDFPGGLVLEPSGQILVLVDTYHADDTVTGAVVAFTATGAIDTSFGSAGSVPLDEAGYIAGSGSNGAFYVSPLGIGVGIERRLADGSLDVAWGDSGYAGGTYSSPVSLDGESIQVSGVDATEHVYTTAETSGGQMAVFRTTPTGFADDTFGIAEPDTGVADAVAVQSDGKVVVGGVDGSYSELRRLNADGSIDAYDAPIVLESLRVCGVGIDAMDRSVAVVNTTNSSITSITVVAARVLADGTRDPTFDGGNLLEVTTSSGVNGSAPCETVAVEPDGSFIVPASHAIAHVGADGSSETIYAGAVGGLAEWTRVAIDGSGAIVAVGSTDGAAPDSDLVIARFLP